MKPLVRWLPQPTLDQKSLKFANGDQIAYGNITAVAAETTRRTSWVSIFVFSFCVIPSILTALVAVLYAKNFNFSLFSLLASAASLLWFFYLIKPTPNVCITLGSGEKYAIPFSEDKSSGKWRQELLSKLSQVS